MEPIYMNFNVHKFIVGFKLLPPSCRNPMRENQQTGTGNVTAAPQHAQM